MSSRFEEWSRLGKQFVDPLTTSSQTSTPPRITCTSSSDTGDDNDEEPVQQSHRRRRRRRATDVQLVTRLDFDASTTNVGSAKKRWPTPLVTRTVYKKAPATKVLPNSVVEWPNQQSSSSSASIIEATPPSVLSRVKAGKLAKRIPNSARQNIGVSSEKMNLLRASLMTTDSVELVKPLTVNSSGCVIDGAPAPVRRHPEIKFRLQRLPATDLSRTNKREWRVVHDDAEEIELVSRESVCEQADVASSRRAFDSYVSQQVDVSGTVGDSPLVDSTNARRHSLPVNSARELSKTSVPSVKEPKQSSAVPTSPIFLASKKRLNSTVASKKPSILKSPAKEPHHPSTSPTSPIIDISKKPSTSTVAFVEAPILKSPAKEPHHPSTSPTSPIIGISKKPLTSTVAFVEAPILKSPAEEPHHPSTVPTSPIFLASKKRLNSTVTSNKPSILKSSTKEQHYSLTAPLSPTLGTSKSRFSSTATSVSALLPSLQKSLDPMTEQNSLLIGSSCVKAFTSSSSSKSTLLGSAVLKWCNTSSSSVSSPNLIPSSYVPEPSRRSRKAYQIKSCVLGEPLTQRYPPSLQNIPTSPIIDSAKILPTRSYSPDDIIPSSVERITRKASRAISPIFKSGKKQPLNRTSTESQQIMPTSPICSPPKKSRLGGSRFRLRVTKPPLPDSTVNSKTSQRRWGLEEQADSRSSQLNIDLSRGDLDNISLKDSHLISKLCMEAEVMNKVFSQTGTEWRSNSGNNKVARRLELNQSVFGIYPLDRSNDQVVRTRCESAETSKKSNKMASPEFDNFRKPKTAVDSQNPEDYNISIYPDTMGLTPLPPESYHIDTEDHRQPSQEYYSEPVIDCFSSQGDSVSQRTSVSPIKTITTISDIPSPPSSVHNIGTCSSQNDETDKPVQYVNMDSAKKKKRHRKGGYADRIQKVLARRKSASSMFRHEMDKDDGKLASKGVELRVDEVWNEFSRVLVRCRNVNDSTLVEGDYEALILVFDPEVVSCKSIGKKTVLKIYPPWQSLVVALLHIKMLLNITKLNVISSWDETISDCASSLRETHQVLQEFSCKCLENHDRKSKCNFKLPCRGGEFLELLFPMQTETSLVASQSQLQCVNSVNTSGGTIAELLANHGQSFRNSAVTVCVQRVFCYNQSEEKSWSLLGRDSCGELCEVILARREDSTADFNNILVGQVFRLNGFKVTKRIPRTQTSRLWSIICSEVTSASEQMYIYIVTPASDAWGLTRLESDFPWARLRLKLTITNLADILQLPSDRNLAFSVLVMLLHVAKNVIYVTDVSLADSNKSYAVISFSSSVVLPSSDMKRNAVLFLGDVQLSRGQLSMDKYSRVLTDQLRCGVTIDDKIWESTSDLVPRIGNANITTAIGDLVHVLGNVVGVDDSSAFSWPSCIACGSDLLSDLKPGVYFCQPCGAPARTRIKMSLEVVVACASMAGTVIKAKLQQESIEKLLPKSQSDQDAYNLELVLGKEVGPLLCLVLNVADNCVSVEELPFPHSQ